MCGQAKRAVADVWLCAAETKLRVGLRPWLAREPVGGGAGPCQIESLQIQKHRPTVSIPQFLKRSLTSLDLEVL